MKATFFLLTYYAERSGAPNVHEEALRERCWQKWMDEASDPGVAKRDKLLEKMRQNPRDWSRDDVRTLCEGFDISCDAPKRGSHYGVSDPTQEMILTVPFDRPIKPVYIKKLVAFVDAVQAARAEDEKGK